MLRFDGLTFGVSQAVFVCLEPDTCEANGGSLENRRDDDISPVFEELVVVCYLACSHFHQCLT